MPDLARSTPPDEAIQKVQRLELLGQLAAGVAHDFANILQLVQSVAHLLEHARDDPDRVRSLAQRLAETARRGNLLTDRLLGFARRRHTGDAPDTPDPDIVCNPADVVSEVCQLLSCTIEHPYSLCCMIEAEGLPWLIRGSQGELEAAVINLAFNARDAMPEGGEITVRVDADCVTSAVVGLRPGHYAKISIADSGIGMSPAHRHRASEPFFTTKPPGKGTGLGLASVKRFVERVGGALRIDSEQGHGTIVTFWLHGEAVANAKPSLAGEPNVGIGCDGSQ